jgi:2-(1,2-epoxy-1,2-dihydrophenyl)acetyl-CoA isomerase
MPPLVLLSVENAVATVTLNRPEKLNAFADDMREQLAAAIASAASRGDVRALVLTGAGRAFSAGGDVRHMAALKERGAGSEALSPLIAAGSEVIRALAALPFPTLAAVNGPAAGAGLNLALACDLRVASEKASFGETFARIGLHPDWGGTWFLPRLVGLPMALELCWLGDVIDAAEALRIGLVNRVVPEAAFASEVAALAARLAAAPVTSVRLAKGNLRSAAQRTLEECLEAEARAQEACWASPDSAEGLGAFVEKRPPRFGAAAAPAGSPSRAARLFE